MCRGMLGDVRTTQQKSSGKHRFQCGRSRGRDRCHDRNLTGIDAACLGELPETTAAPAPSGLHARGGGANRRHVDAARR